MISWLFLLAVLSVLVIFISFASSSRRGNYALAAQKSSERRRCLASHVPATGLPLSRPRGSAGDGRSAAAAPEAKGVRSNGGSSLRAEGEVVCAFEDGLHELLRGTFLHCRGGAGGGYALVRWKVLRGLWCRRRESRERAKQGRECIHDCSLWREEQHPHDTIYGRDARHPCHHRPGHIGSTPLSSHGIPHTPLHSVCSTFSTLLVDIGRWSQQMARL